MTNPGFEPRAGTVNLHGAKSVSSAVRGIVLSSASPDDENSSAAPAEDCVDAEIGFARPWPFLSDFGAMKITSSGLSLVCPPIRCGRLGSPALAFAVCSLLSTLTPAWAAAPSLPMGQPYTVPTAAIELVWIPPGEFTMGSPESEESRSVDEGPQTKVTLSRGFWLGKCELTQAQWKALGGTSIKKLFARFCAQTPAPQGETWTFPGEDDNRPMSYMTWEDAIEICRKLTQQERAAGRLPEDWSYTLPTEAQWEYACRAGTTGAYAGELDAMAWYIGNSGNLTHPVAKKQPNAWGLYDMHGNVWEWCRDWYADRLPGGAATDPVGAPSGTDHVLRGGSGGYPADYCRSALRYWGAPGFCSSFVGFRLALSAVQPGAR